MVILCEQRSEGQNGINRISTLYNVKKRRSVLNGCTGATLTSVIDASRRSYVLR